MRLSLLALTVTVLSAQTSLPLAPKDWIESAYYCYDSGSYCNPIKVALSNSAGALTFTFPQAPANPPLATSWNEISYLQTRYTKSIATAASLSITVQDTFTVGTQFIGTWDDDGNTCGGDATTRIIIERQGDNGSGVGKYAYYRWWSNPLSYDLTVGAGVLTVTTPLTPDQWSDVDGQFGTSNVPMFDAALEHVGLLGITFGEGCWFGHGLDVLGGTAQFYLISFQIN